MGRSRKWKNKMIKSIRKRYKYKKYLEFKANNKSNNKKERIKEKEIKQNKVLRILMMTNPSKNSKKKTRNKSMKYNRMTLLLKSTTNLLSLATLNWIAISSAMSLKSCTSNASLTARRSLSVLRRQMCSFFFLMTRWICHFVIMLCS